MSSFPTGCILSDRPAIETHVTKKGTRISKTSLFNPFHSAKLRVKRNIQVDFARYYTTENQQKPWKKMVENRNIIPDFPIGRAVENFQLITGHNCIDCQFIGS